MQVALRIATLTGHFYRQQAATLRIGAILMTIAAHYLSVNADSIEFDCFEEGTLRPGKNLIVKLSARGGLGFTKVSSLICNFFQSTESPVF